MTYTPKRFAQWLPLGARQIECPQSHRFRPDMQQRNGAGTVICRQCMTTLLVLADTDARCLVVIEVGPKELDYLATLRLDAHMELVWLLTHPMQETKAA